MTTETQARAADDADAVVEGPADFCGARCGSRRRHGPEARKGLSGRVRDVFSIVGDLIYMVAALGMSLFTMDRIDREETRR